MCYDVPDHMHLNKMYRHITVVSPLCWRKPWGRNINKKSSREEEITAR